MQPSEQHFHEWDVVSAWGIILGVTRCKTCGEVAKATNVRSVRPCSRVSPKQP